jgi:hypothetical protein
VALGDFVQTLSKEKYAVEAPSEEMPGLVEIVKALLDGCVRYVPKALSLSVAERIQ